MKKAKKLNEKKLKKAKKAETGNKDAENQNENEGDDVDEYAGFTSKPGQSAKVRGTFKLKQQSKIHEKITNKKKKHMRKQKELNEIKMEKLENKADRKAMKRKRVEEVDGLSSKIQKYKSLIQNTQNLNQTKAKRGKWYIE